MDQQLQNGGVLIFFPAGKSPPHPRGIRDKKWHSGFIKLAAKYRAPLLPAWITRQQRPVLRQHAGLRQPAAAAADAADVSPPQQPAG
jgi:putative hemolysin